MDFYASTLVSEFNLKMDKMILYECPCYMEYVTENGQRVDSEDVMRLLLMYSKSYAACVRLKYSNEEVLVKHQQLPIMIGSNIDLFLRPNVNFIHQAGAFILAGGIKILPAFITNNLRSGHVYRLKEKDVYKWYISMDLEEDDVNSTLIHLVQFSPLPGRVTMTSTKRYTEKRCGVRGYSIKEEVLPELPNEEVIFNEINKLSPINKLTNNEHYVHAHEYIDFFECSIVNYPALDDLCNKTIITPTSIFETAIKKWSTLPQNSSKLGTLVSGNLFYTLSSKSVSYIKNDEFKTAYLTVEGHRVSMIDKLVSIVKRHINHGVKNSNALKLPQDSSHFICPLNVKEMKNAGETMALAQFVMVAPTVTLARVLRFLQKYASKEKSQKNHLRVVIEGWMTNYWVSPKTQLKMKRQIILVTMVYEERYLIIYHEGHLPVKYSPKYRMFVGVHEAQHNYKGVFDGYTDFADYTSFAMNFHRAPLHMPPAKATVSINNIKGSCSSLSSRSDLHSFVHSIGFTNSAVMTTDIGLGTENESCEDYEYVSFSDPTKFILAVKKYNCDDTRFAELEESDILAKHDWGRYVDVPELKKMPDSIKVYFEKLDKKIQANLDKVGGRPELLPPYALGAKTCEEHGQCYRDLFVHDADEHFKRIVTYLDNIKRYSYNVLPEIKGDETVRLLKKRKSTNSVGSSSSNGSVSQLSTNANAAQSNSDSLKMNLDEHSNTNRILLYTALNNLNCDTVEDGIVIDEKFHRNSPLKLFSVTLLLRVYAHTEYKSFSNKSCALKPNGVYDYTPIIAKADGKIIFGVLVTDQKVRIQKRRTINICESFIKNTYRYMISMNDPLDRPKIIDSFFQKNTTNQKSMISIHYHYTDRLGVGTKLSNLHGQKGIVSAVKDLSQYKFWTRDGKLVHPQLLFSKQSLVGRTTASQTISMLNSPNLAIGENGELAAPLLFFVHQIEAYAKCKQMLPKNDLMTAENGFTANGLVASMNLMSKQYPLNETIKENTFVLDLLKLGHVHVSIDPNEQMLTEANNLEIATTSTSRPRTRTISTKTTILNKKKDVPEFKLKSKIKVEDTETDLLDRIYSKIDDDNDDAKSTCINEEEKVYVNEEKVTAMIGSLTTVNAIMDTVKCEGSSSTNTSIHFTDDDEEEEDSKKDDSDDDEHEDVIMTDVYEDDAVSGASSEDHEDMECENMDDDDD